MPSEIIVSQCDSPCEPRLSKKRLKVRQDSEEKETITHMIVGKPDILLDDEISDLSDVWNSHYIEDDDSRQPLVIIQPENQSNQQQNHSLLRIDSTSNNNQNQLGYTESDCPSLQAEDSGSAAYAPYGCGNLITWDPLNICQYQREDSSSTKFPYSPQCVSTFDQQNNNRNYEHCDESSMMKHGSSPEAIPIEPSTSKATPIIVLVMDPVVRKVDLILVEIDLQECNVQDLLDRTISTTNNFQNKKKGNKCHKLKLKIPSDYSNNNVQCSRPSSLIDWDLLQKHQLEHSKGNQSNDKKYDGIVCRWPKKPQTMINCIGLKMYDVHPYEILIAKPSGISKKLCCNIASSVLNYFLQISVLYLHVDSYGAEEEIKSEATPLKKDEIMLLSRAHRPSYSKKSISSNTTATTTATSIPTSYMNTKHLYSNLFGKKSKMVSPFLSFPFQHLGKNILEQNIIHK